MIKKKWKLRIPAISQLWLIRFAETEEEVFDQVVSKLEADNPKIAWRDRSVWEVRPCLDPWGRQETEEPSRPIRPEEEE